MPYNYIAKMMGYKGGDKYHCSMLCYDKMKGQMMITADVADAN